MGQARRRRQQLGDLYGTPEGSNRPASALAQLLPQGGRQRNLRRLRQYLRPEHLQEVTELLAHGAPDWSRSYPPLPAHAAQFGSVVVGCHSGLLRVALHPWGVAA